MPPKLVLIPREQPHRRVRKTAVSAALSAGLLIPALAFGKTADAGATGTSPQAPASPGRSSLSPTPPAGTSTPGSPTVRTTPTTPTATTPTTPTATSPTTTTPVTSTTPTGTGTTGTGTTGSGTGTTGTGTTGSGTGTTGTGTTGSGTGTTGTGTTGSGTGTTGTGATGSGTGTTGTGTTGPVVVHPTPRHAGSGHGASRRRRHDRSRHEHRARPTTGPLDGVAHAGSMAAHEGVTHSAGYGVTAPHRSTPPAVANPAPSTPTPAPLATGSIGGPQGSFLTDPLSAGELARYAALVGGRARPPKYLETIYREAGRHYGIPWQILAAINYVETDYGRDLAVSSAGAIGWMQFMPATWTEYGVSVSARGRLVSGVPDPWQPRDAIFAAARYLKANGAVHNLAKAVFGYNHARWYVSEVMTIAAEIDTHGLRASSKARRKIAAMRTMARLLNGLPYVWGGGHGNWSLSDGYDCSGFVSAVLHSAGYLTIPVTTTALPGQPGILSGPGRWVTIFDRTDAGIGEDHVIIDIEGQWWESGGGGPTGAARVHRILHMNAAYLQTFNQVLHPRGL